jgi:hypothetical protein
MPTGCPSDGENRKADTWLKYEISAGRLSNFRFTHTPTNRVIIGAAIVATAFQSTVISIPLEDTQFLN